MSEREEEEKKKKKRKGQCFFGVDAGNGEARVYPRRHLSLCVLARHPRKRGKRRETVTFSCCAFACFALLLLRDKRSVRRRASPGADSNRSESLCPPPKKGCQLRWASVLIVAFHTFRQFLYKKIPASVHRNYKSLVLISPCFDQKNLGLSRNRGLPLGKTVRRPLPDYHQYTPPAAAGAEPEFSRIDGFILRLVTLQNGHNSSHLAHGPYFYFAIIFTCLFASPSLPHTLRAT